MRLEEKVDPSRKFFWMTVLIVMSHQSFILRSRSFFENTWKCSRIQRMWSISLPDSKWRLCRLDSLRKMYADRKISHLAKWN